MKSCPLYYVTNSLISIISTVHTNSTQLHHIHNILDCAVPLFHEISTYVVTSVTAYRSSIVDNIQAKLECHCIYTPSQWLYVLSTLKVNCKKHDNLIFVCIWSPILKLVRSCPLHYVTHSLIKLLNHYIAVDINFVDVRQLQLVYGIQVPCQ